MDEVLQEWQDGALCGVGLVARREVFTVCLDETAVIPFLVVKAAEAGLRQVDGPDAVGTALGVAPAGENLAGEVAVDGAAGMSVAHLNDKHVVGGVSVAVARRLVAVDAVMASLEVVDI